ncbi:serine/threonine protein phosphatase [Gordoniibacillus kamchatkensis]|uniref:Serine/threonine protein phosphatase n=1 Tax=Gordoniibacillus kamchatkensis TaxID=1590651 RepID=A0ABR5AGD3_9BACL|nr:metallophosphoesterase family protein [Paenibacillus sp. VKM B-2647]KIL39768.1 serine/threonine protein phosphatase [Paenibacillus sp. VKM B-2647]
MEKIAILSDVHGNLPALEAVYKDIARRRIRRIVCLGDLVGKGPQPAQTVDRIRERCEFVAQGNWEAGIAREQELPEGKWQQEQIGAERIDYLANLPFSIDLTLSGQLVRLFHASADSVFRRVLRKAPKREKLELFANTPQTGTPDGGRTPDVVGYGDIHLPYLLTLKPRAADSRREKGRQPRGRTLFNAGSVGVPYDGIAQPSYVIVEGTAGDEPAPLSIQLVRVPYDVELAAEAARAADMPGSERYIAEVRAGLCFK